jgi:hypothetical protein
MSWEIITCPLSACFLGLSTAQAHEAQTLKWSDLRGPFDRENATEAYGALPEPSETANREPTFFDKMLRRVGRSPLSRRAAEEASLILLEQLRDARLFDTRPELTMGREEDFCGQFDPAALVALRTALSDASFESRAVDARVALLEHGEGRPASTHTHADYPNLFLDGRAAIYLPCELTRPVRGVPNDIGSTLALRREATRALAALGVDDARAVSSGPYSDSRLYAVVRSLDAIMSAAALAEKAARVLVLSW